MLRALAIKLLTTLLAVSSSFALPAEKERWIRIETENFTLYSDAGKKQALRIGKRLEQLREVLLETTAGMAVASPLPTTIYVFADDDSFGPYDTRTGGDPDQAVAGYFVRMIDGNYIAINASAEVLPYPVILHEYMHYFLENNIPGIPLWLNEGIAEVYSTFTVEPGRPETVALAHPIPRHLWWLSNHPMLPLDALFAVDTSSDDYNESERRGTFYAQSWALAHFLLVNSDVRGGLGEFVGRISAGAPAIEAFENAFDMDLLAAEQALIAHVEAGTPQRIRYTPKEALEKRSARAEPVERKELLYRLGDLLVHNEPLPVEAAERHLRAALEIDPEYVDAFVALAMLRLGEGRPDDAVELAARAVELDPDNVRALVVQGTCVIEKVFSGVAEDGSIPAVTPIDLIRVRTRFRMALELSPGHVDALIGLGTTYLFQRSDLTEGIEALTAAWRSRPSRREALYQLIVLHARSGDLRRARSLLDRALRPSGEAGLILAAETEIVRVGMESVEALVAHEKFDEAATRIESIANGLGDDALRRGLMAYLARISAAADADRIERLRQELAAAEHGGDERRARELRQALSEQVGESTAYEDELERFNEAVELSNAGALEEAASLFGELARSTEREELRILAADHARRLQESLSHNRAVDAFNRALESARSGELDEAESLLLRLLDTEPPDEIKADAEGLLRDVLRSRGAPE